MWVEAEPDAWDPDGSTSTTDDDPRVVLESAFDTDAGAGDVSYANEWAGQTVNGIFR